MPSTTGPPCPSHSRESRAHPLRSGESILYPLLMADDYNIQHPDLSNLSVRQLFLLGSVRATRLSLSAPVNNIYGYLYMYQAAFAAI